MVIKILTLQTSDNTTKLKETNEPSQLCNLKWTSHDILYYLGSIKSFSQKSLSIFIFSQYIFQKLLPIFIFFLYFVSRFFPGGKVWGYPAILFIVFKVAISKPPNGVQGIGIFEVYNCIPYINELGNLIRTKKLIRSWNKKRGNPHIRGDLSYL